MVRACDQRRKIATAVFILVMLRRRRSRRRARNAWVKSWVGRREKLGAYHNLVQELAEEDPEMYRRYLRVEESTMEMILNAIADDIWREDSHMRRAISPKQRLAITMRFLATGSFSVNANHYRLDAIDSM